MQQPSLRARNSWGATLLVAGGCSAVGVGLSWIVVGLIGTPGAGLREAVQAQMAGAGVENPVTAVLLNFRGYDTLLETLVLLAALLAVWTLTADEAWGRRVGVMQRVSRHGVLSVLGRLLPPFGVMIGVYVVWAGARTAGGAFQGGTILAAVWLLIMLSDAAPRPRASSPVLRAAILLGPVVFLAVGAAGLGRAGAYLGYPPAAAKPLLLVIEAALAPSIAVILALIVAGPPVRP